MHSLHSELVYFYCMLTPKKHRFIVIAIIAFVLVCLQWPYFSSYPTSIHAWAQSDFFSISRGFMRNGFNFFLPEEYIYNKQFPHDWRVADTTTITAVNFPIHQYVVALLMKLFGSEGPEIYRWYSFSFGMLGLNYLYKLSRVLRLNDIQSTMIVLLAAFSPIFLFYQANFLTSLPALATTIWGVYHYLKFLTNDAQRNWRYAIILLTLSALTRTTFIIPLVAVSAHYVFQMMRQKNRNFRPLVVAAIGCCCVLAYQLYNNSLSARYGSHFLSSLRPVRSYDELTSFLGAIYENWQDDYFSSVQWLFLLVLMCLSLSKAPRILHLNSSHPTFFILIYLLGCVSFFAAMGQQFVFHDYYFLDTFFLPILLVSVLGIRFFPALITIAQIRYTLFGITAFLMLLGGWSKLRERYEPNPNDLVSRTIAAFASAPELLDRNHVPKDAKILVFGAYGPNAPFMMMDRKGYSVDHIDPDFFKTILTWDIDYVMVSHFFLKEVLIPSFPYVTQYLVPVSTNFEVSLFRLSQSPQAGDLSHRMQTGPKSYRYYTTTTPTYLGDRYWEFLPKVERMDSSYLFSVGTSNQFGFKWITETTSLMKDKNPDILHVRLKVKLADPGAGHEIDVFGLKDGNSLFFHPFRLNELVKNTPEWQWVGLSDALPAIDGAYTIGFHHCNTGGTTVLIDSVQIGVY